MIYFLPLCGSNLYFYRSIVFFFVLLCFPSLTPFLSAGFKRQKGTVLIICSPRSSDCLSRSLSHPPFNYWTNPADRQIYSLGSTQCLKCLNTTGCCGRQSSKGVDTWYPLYSSASLNSQYTLCYNRNTGVIYSPCFIIHWLRLIQDTSGSAISYRHTETVEMVRFF